MYKIYNLSTGKYGILYKNLSAARHMARAYSLWARNERDVIDMETGEVMAQYSNGQETYRAKG